MSPLQHWDQMSAQNHYCTHIRLKLQPKYSRDGVAPSVMNGGGVLYCIALSNKCGMQSDEVCF